MFKGYYIFADVYQRSKLVLAEIIALVQTDDIGRLNFVQLPKMKKKNEYPDLPVVNVIMYRKFDLHFLTSLNFSYYDIISD